MTTQKIPVTLIPSTNAQGQITWEMGINGSAPVGPPNYPAITVPKGNSADVTFTIQNGQGQAIAFANVPMLVPPKTTGLDAPSVNGASMTVTDHNLKQGDVPYVLVFNGAPKLDPIIKNDGGGSLAFSDYMASPMFDVVAFLVVAALVFLVTRAVYNRKAGA